MKTKSEYACIICGQETAGNDHWFLIVANRWQDKLRILQWNPALAGQAGVQHVCSASHVQELVVHWMTTGCVEYPFAQVTTRGAKQTFRQLLPFTARVDSEAEVDTSGAQAIGELSVHRESMQRILRESPESLSSILDALLSALQRNQQLPEQEFDEEEAELCGVGRQV